MHINKGKIVVGIEFEVTDGFIQLFDSLCACCSFVSREEFLGIIFFHIENIFPHKLIHSLFMQSLQTVLQILVSINAFLVLELHFSVVTFFDFVHQFADKECHKAVERVLFVADIVMTEDFFKLVDDFAILHRERLQIAFPKNIHADIVGL